MHQSYLVIDNAWNRHWNADIIGKRFEIAPSYTAIISSPFPPDYKRVKDMVEIVLTQSKEE